MSNAVLTNLIRFIGLLLLQGLILKRIELGGFLGSHLHVFLYPLFIIILPLRTQRTLVILLGFILGLCIDVFYNSLGVHASALVFTAFMRAIVLWMVQPRGGYNVNFSPTRRRMGMNWFLRYSAIMMALHLFFYFSVEAFTFVYIVDILLSTLVSFVVSMIAVFVFQTLFDPLD